VRIVSAATARIATAATGNATGVADPPGVAEVLALAGRQHLSLRGLVAPYRQVRTAGGVAVERGGGRDRREWDRADRSRRDESGGDAKPRLTTGGLTGSDPIDRERLLADEDQRAQLRMEEDRRRRLQMYEEDRRRENRLERDRRDRVEDDLDDRIELLQDERDRAAELDRRERVRAEMDRRDRLQDELNRRDRTP